MLSLILALVGLALAIYGVFVLVGGSVIFGIVLIVVGVVIFAASRNGAVL